MSETQDRALDPSSMSGYELLMAMARGDLPPAPISQLIGMTSFGGTEGAIHVELVPEQHHYNPLGTVHGGIISALLDTAAGCSVHSTLPAGVGYTSLDLTVKFLRPATVASGLLRAEGSVIHRGRRTALAQAVLLDAAGKQVAHATSSCMIFA